MSDLVNAQGIFSLFRRSYTRAMDPHEDALAIFRAGVEGVAPDRLVRESLSLAEGGRFLAIRSLGGTSCLDLSGFDRIFVTGMGKAAAAMARGLESVLGPRLSGGILAVKEGPAAESASRGAGGPARLRFVEAGHPLPDARSEAAGRALLGLGASLGTVLAERDLVIVLVSGGGSALLCAPAEGLSLADKLSATRLLLASGATIDEMNCVRKHLSAVKGGRLAAALAPAAILSLVLSDVVGDGLDVIASGPTVPDPTTFADALAIVRRRGLASRLPGAVLRRLEDGAAGRLEETPKPGSPAFSRATASLVGANRLALAAAADEARQLGYNCLVLSSRVTGEAREAALVYLGIGKDIVASAFPLARPACILAGGETTVTLRGRGRGGRNQEMALAFLVALGASPRDGEGLSFLSAGTDGIDGPTDAAGALVDLGLYRRALAAGLDPAGALGDNDSYGFFSAAGGLVKTGPTGTNVCDLQVLLAT